MTAKPRYGVDSKCHDLAEHFLSEIKGSTPMDMQELAEAIQRLCEDFCRDVADDADGKITGMMEG